MENNNIMSVELTEWAELASCVKSPVAANLASLLRSMASMTDAELLEARVTTSGLRRRFVST